MKRAIVLGGGISGVEAAIELRKKGLEVELVSDRDYLFVYPLAIWILTGERSFDRVKMSLSQIARAHGFSLTVDEVTAVSGKERSFTLQRDGDREDFDYLVLALGLTRWGTKAGSTSSLSAGRLRRARPSKDSSIL
jgi:sulfide:quinone oxidoreductase